MLINRKDLDLFQPEIADLLFERITNAFTSKEEKSQGTTLFLSHKHDENDILMKVVKLLRSLGAKVYIDWEDKEMPSETTGETAERLKLKIIENRKFILLATEKAIASKWCNWELGFGDAKKYYKDIAVMPISENDGSWSGNEYLQIYPIIKIEKEDYFVEFKGIKIKLVDWLKS